MNFESVRSIIDTYIKKNGVEAITGDILNNVLNTMLDDVDTAISSIEPSPGGGSGEGGVSEEDVLNILEKNNYITSSALSSYYTKAESDARYLALNGGGQVVSPTDTPLYLKSGASDSYIGFRNSSDSILGYYGFRGTTPIVYSGVSSAYYLIHSGNIESYAITPVGGTINGALTSYGGFISYGTPSFTAIRESGWSYLRLQSASKLWDIATTDASDGMLNTPYALEFREDGQGYWGFALRYNTSSYGIGVFVANGQEASIGFLSNSSASSNKLPQWVIGNKDAETFGFWNTSSARFGITISKDFSTNVEGNICINRPTNYSNDYDEGLRCNLGGSQSWAGVVIGGAAFSTSGAGVGVYSLLVNNQLFRIRQNHTDVLTMNTSNQVNINGNLIVSGDFSFGSDMRFKDKIEDMGISIADIAKAPLFTYKWNDREDDIIYLGSSAQYWEKIAPWLVSGDDFKSLNYATLGVAMGISLAKKTINHEERIKILEAEIKRIKREQYGS